MTLPNKILEDSIYMSMGIAPIGPAWADVNRALAKLPPDEARRMRRKFRKLWRKMASNAPGDVSPNIHAIVVRDLGKGSQRPTKKMMIARKRHVSSRVHREVRRLLNKTMPAGYSDYVF